MFGESILLSSKPVFRQEKKYLLGDILKVKKSYIILT
jgi:hypothetical protein